MKFKIKNIEEIADNIVISFETSFGLDKFRTNISKKYLDKLTGRPFWLLALRNFIAQKYKYFEEQEKMPKKYVKFIDKEMDMEDIEDTSTGKMKTLNEKLNESFRLEIEKQNKLVKDRFEEHHALVNKRRELERKVIGENRTIKRLEAETLKNNGKKLQSKVQL